jgi:hypothetical protein
LAQLAISKKTIDDAHRMAKIPTLLSHTELTALENFSHEIATVGQLRAAGFSSTAVANRCRPGGPWQRLLPGVVLFHPGKATRTQQLHAAVAHVGGDCVITGTDALRAYGLALPVSPSVHLLVPAHRRLLPQEFVRLERTTRPPKPVTAQGLPFSPPARAVLDIARRERNIEQLHKVLRLAIYHGLCGTKQLREELDAGNQRGSAAVREVLESLGPAADTFAFQAARELVESTPLPPPRWNIAVCDRRDYPLGRVDAWWDQVAMGWQFTMGQLEESSPKHLALTAAGVMLVRTSPEKIKQERHLVARELTNAFTVAAKRIPPRVRTSAAHDLALASR